MQIKRRGLSTHSCCSTFSLPSRISQRKRIAFVSLVGVDLDVVLTLTGKEWVGYEEILRCHRLRQGLRTRMMMWMM
jgi:hypothetical protein